MCTGVKVGMKEGRKYVGCVYLFVWEEGQGRGREECGWRAGGGAGGGEQQSNIAQIQLRRLPLCLRKRKEKQQRQQNQQPPKQALMARCP